MDHLVAVVEGEDPREPIASAALGRLAEDDTGMVEQLEGHRARIGGRAEPASALSAA